MKAEFIPVLISVIIALPLGFIIGKLLVQSRYKAVEAGLRATNHKLTEEKEKAAHEMEKLSEKLSIETQNRENLRLQLTEKDARIRHLEELHRMQEEELQKVRGELQKEFENLANKILEEKSEKFTRQNRDNLKMILQPLNEKILDFEKKIERTHKESIDYHAALRQQIKGLQELNQVITKETENLTKALKGDSKTQGNWGELVLERILEKSGLEKGREYEVEKSFTTTDEGRSYYRPDVIIHLPGNRKLIIDSKVSLKHYEQYINAENKEEKEVFLKSHLNSLKRHIEQLSAKKYEHLYEMESPDFVMMFVPVEPAFAVALNKDPELYVKAFDKNIVIVTPTTLLATLRTIDTMWNNEKQQQNAIEIARQAGGLYDKFTNLIQDLEKVGNRMDMAKKDYEAAMNKLISGSGNLISRVEKLKKMGAKAKKALPDKWVNRADDSD